MKNYYISDIAKITGASHREIYKFIRNYEFYDFAGVNSMSELPDGVCNGSPSKVLTEEQFEYVLEKMRNKGWTNDKRESLKSELDLVYLIDLTPEGFVKEGDEKVRRFKIGFTSKPILKRLSEYQVCIPEAKLYKTWKINQVAERSLLQVISKFGCRRIGSTEVFEVYDFETFINKIEMHASEHE